MDILSSDFLLFIGNKALRICLILAAAALVLRFLRDVVSRLFVTRPSGKIFYFDERRARTLSILLQSIMRYVIYFIAIILVLQEFSIDTTSIVAGAGILGLAIGVGAQSLIKDLITGFFVILEDQYAVGDYIASGDMTGTVEEIGFRVTKLRDANGVLHIIPHGLITKITNYTRGHMVAAVTVPVAYEADLSKVLELFAEACRQVGSAMPEVIDEPKVVGVVEFQPGGLVAKIVAKTVPLEQGKVEAALRYRIKILFDENGIPMPTVRQNS
ncbi:mechanosensitive ion channel family protein|uniref:Small conductance mechanosensitive channel n=1 Tax=Dendrosporobacter quercicolus TaxID=146817 RepID=A0A1G9XYD1_9FIRM|nr:mechanosensitive ion channel family protein [Dendrosporobacter quercicolus]NSL49042.1 mechanosensitive ion channel family protein [Dendrosporobacter quercicolus DSM 1736]SDN01787.1 small conductance mechanosensitive channel [Dendrosporobacter quercicolus]